jgi:hypothetical protein
MVWSLVMMLIVLFKLFSAFFSCMTEFFDRSSKLFNYSVYILHQIYDLCHMQTVFTTFGACVGERLPLFPLIVQFLEKFLHLKKFQLLFLFLSVFVFLCFNIPTSLWQTGTLKPVLIKEHLVHLYQPQGVSPLACSISVGSVIGLSITLQVFLHLSCLLENI